MSMYLRFMTFPIINDFTAKAANRATEIPSERLIQHQQTMHFVHLRTRLLERLGAQLTVHDSASACSRKPATDFHAAFRLPLLF